MPILILLVVGGYLLIKCIYEDAAQRKRMDDYMSRRVANGAHLPIDEEKEDAYFYELEENYKYGDKSMFPPEKLDYFAHTPGAWHLWAKSEAEEKMIAEGYAPYHEHFNYDRTVYNDHYFYRTSREGKGEQEYYRQKAMREKYNSRNF
ncbi:hypothetical protein SDC9_124961 [bioreactor metagenome]|uniref:Uncharacterized protein n=1 Tax=bioreactor metagenome TaxID=1076179 RepID=A0A645CLX5_9ZZZZ